MMFLTDTVCLMHLLIIWDGLSFNCKNRFSYKICLLNSNTPVCVVKEKYDLFKTKNSIINQLLSYTPVWSIDCQCACSKETCYLYRPPGTFRSPTDWAQFHEWLVVSFHWPLWGLSFYIYNKVVAVTAVYKVVDFQGIG